MIKSGKCALVLAATVLGCEPGQVVLVDAMSGGGAVLRATLTVRALVHPADSALAASLGWQGGVPGAQISLLRIGTAEWSTESTDTGGQTRIEGLLPGLYRVSTGKTLTRAEAEQRGGAVRAFGDGRTVTVSGDTEVELSLLADRPGGLVISEIGNGTPVPWETGGNSYRSGMFIEVFNNSNRTVYLDGVLLGANPGLYRFTIPTPCPMSEPVRTDSGGVYVRAVLAFPGTGTEYPMAPGEVRTVAVRAIDHTPVHHTLLDLSSADFEFPAGGNPAVPDMRSVGIEAFSPGNLLVTNNVYFLAEPTDVAGLPLAFRAGNGDQYLRVPMRLLYDVIAFGRIWPDNDRETPPCVPMIHPTFDRYEGSLFEIGFDADPAYNSVRSVQRKVLRTDGARWILSNTNTTAVDFFHGIKTPGAIPTIMDGQMSYRKQ